VIAELLLAASLWAGQLVDGHVHKRPHGGALGHCGPLLLEVAIFPDRIDVWLLDEKEVTQEPRGKELTLTVEGPEVPRRRFTARPRGDHFRDSFSYGSPNQVHIVAELRDGGRVCRSTIQWTLLDARDRLDDSLGRKPRLDPRRRPLR
jgi:hypothetical protein